MSIFSANTMRGNAGLTEARKAADATHDKRARINAALVAMPAVKKIRSGHTPHEIEVYVWSGGHEDLIEKIKSTLGSDAYAVDLVFGVIQIRV